MSKNRKILIIDDDEELIEELGIILKDEKYEIISARSGEEGILKFEENTGAIVLLDLKLPKMDGVHVYQKITKINPNADVIVMTGSFEKEKSKELLKRGVKDAVFKPFEVEDLLSKIKNIK